MYCYEDDLKRRLDEETLVALADDDGDGEADMGVLAAAIADAGAEIDAALAGRYAVPFEETPALIRTVAARLAIAALFRRRRETPSAEHSAECERARSLLRLLAQGQMRLAGVGALSIPESNRAGDDKINKTDTLNHF